MSLFQCENCGARENTVFGNYWTSVAGEKNMCSECFTGKWHGQFEKIILPKGMFKTARNGNLEHIETGEQDCRKYVTA